MLNHSEKIYPKDTIQNPEKAICPRIFTWRLIQHKKRGHLAIPHLQNIYVMMNSLDGILCSQQKMTVKDIIKWIITITKLD